jgi:hypothetical protein
MNNKKKFKIAIYVSGELRTYLKQDNMLPNFVNFLRHWGHEVSVVGYLWKHSLPKDRVIDFDIFDDYSIVDQKKITEWIKKDILTRRVITSENIDNKIILDDINLDRFIENYTIHGQQYLGQVWGGLECFEWNYKKYIQDHDFHIRWRWDMGWALEPSTYDSDRAVIFDNVLQSSYNNDRYEPRIMTTGMTTLFSAVCNHHLNYAGTIDDRFFVCNNMAMKNLMEQDTSTRIHNTLINYTSMSQETPNTHTLWWDVLLRYTDIGVQFPFESYILDQVK